MKILTKWTMLVVLGFTCSATAAETNPSDSGQVPADLLAEMGLGQMQVMSDVQGQEIRGSGFYFHPHRHYGYTKHRYSLVKLAFRHVFQHKGKSQHAKHNAVHKIGLAFGKRFFSKPKFNFIFYRYSRFQGGGRR